MPKLSWPALLALMLLGALLVAACDDDDDGGGAATATATATATENADDDDDAATATGTATPAEAAGGTEVLVSLSEWAVDPEVDEIDAGEVTFAVANEGAQAHEFVIIRSDEDPDALPLEASVVVEDDVDVVDKIEPQPAGATELLTVKLEAGNYLLICNIAGHYLLGMTIEFTVN